MHNSTPVKSTTRAVAAAGSWFPVWIRLALRLILAAAPLGFPGIAQLALALPPQVGAIRWDAWQDTATNDGILPAVNTDLAPNQWHYRLPFFAQLTGSNSVSINGNRQSIMDQEIQYAANAGIRYWAFDIAPASGTYSGMGIGLQLYFNSAFKSRINFAGILEGNAINDISGQGRWSNQVVRYVNYFKDPSYQKVLGNRPLFYVLEPVTATNVAAVAAEVAQLRAASTNAGLGSPYIVDMAGTLTTLTNYGFDALSAYDIFNGASGTGTPYTNYAAIVHNSWESWKATGANVVPIVSSGFDNRPRYYNPPFWGGGSTNYIAAPTPVELGNLLANALNWTSTNQSACCPANTIILYAWNEHDEGGWICPTLNTNDWLTPDVSRLDAISTVLGMNWSFEFPPAEGGWYSGTALPSVTGFGWSNNLGTQAIADATAGHFSTAAEGSQALRLGVNDYVQKDIGFTTPDCCYTLTFGLLQDKYVPNTNSVVRAEVFDGTNLLGSGDFMVPATPDVWQSNALAVVSPHQPSGNLIIRFTGVAGDPWIDQAGIAAQYQWLPVSLLNPSFELPVTTGWYNGWLSTNASFGWSNSLSHLYCLAAANGHFSAAADGAQALLLWYGFNPASGISQDAGPTVADAIYRLSFSLLQDEYPGNQNPNSALQAQIFDGTNLLASGSFTVPATPDLWQANTLIAFTQHQSSGNLSIRFTVVSGGPWLDKVSLSVLRKMPAPLKVEGSPVILSNGRFHARFSGVPGFLYSVQSAPGVAGPWIIVTNSVIGSDGVIDYEEERTPPPDAQFYRATLF